MNEGARSDYLCSVFLDLNSRCNASPAETIYVGLIHLIESGMKKKAYER